MIGKLIFAALLLAAPLGAQQVRTLRPDSLLGHWRTPAGDRGFEFHSDGRAVVYVIERGREYRGQAGWFSFERSGKHGLCLDRNNQYQSPDKECAAFRATSRSLWYGGVLYVRQPKPLPAVMR